MRPLLFVAWGLVSCAAPSSSVTAAGPLTADVAPAMEPGPAVTPITSLRAWLDARPGAVVRLPVHVELSALGVKAAWVGDDAERLAVRCDDSRLGISLADRARSLGPHLWLRGTLSGAGVFALHAVEGAVSEAPPHHASRARP